MKSIFYFFLTADWKYTTEHHDLIFIMRLINKNTKKKSTTKNNLLLVGCKKKYLYFHYQRHNIDFSDNMEKRTCSIKSFIFPFYFFFTLHQRTLKCYKEMCLILHGKKQKRTTSISTDGGYRLVAQLNRKRTATEKNSTLSLEKTKDLCKALMQISKNYTTDNNKRTK